MYEYESIPVVKRENFAAKFIDIEELIYKTESPNATPVSYVTY